MRLMHSGAGMHDDDGSEAQSPAPLPAKVAFAAAIADADDLERREASRSPSASTLPFPLTQRPTLLPVPSERLFASWRTSSDSPPIASTRPSRWRSASPLCACGSPVVTFAPTTRFDQCRQRANVAVRRSDGGSHLPLPSPLPEPPLSSMCSSAGWLTASALRAIALPQPYFVTSNPPTPSPQRPSASAQIEVVRDAVLDDFSDTLSSADSACSTNSSSLTLLDTYSSAGWPRPPPSLVLNIPLPSATLRASSEHTHSSAFFLADGVAISTAGAATDTTPQSFTDTSNVTFTLLEPEMTRTRTVTHDFAATADLISERRHVDGAATERASAALIVCCDEILTTHPKDEPCMATGKVPPQLLLENLSLSSTPEVTPSTGPAGLPLSPPASSLELMNPRVMLLTPDTPDKQLSEAPLHDSFLSANAEIVADATVEDATTPQLQSSSTAFPANPQWGDEGSSEVPQTTAVSASKSAAVISTVGIGSVSSLDNDGDAAVGAHPTRTTAALHSSLLTAASSSSSDVGDGCEGALGSPRICASPEKTGKDSVVVGTPPPPYSPQHPAETRSPRDRERCAIASAAAADVLSPLPPRPAPAPPRPRPFPHSSECSTEWAKCCLTCEAEQFPSSSDDLHREKSPASSEGPLHQSLLSDAARRASLQSSCVKGVGTPVDMAGSITRVTTNASGCVVVGEDTANGPPLAKQLIHSGTSDIGAGAPCVSKHPKGAATAVSTLPLTSPAPPRSLLVAPYWSSFCLSGDQDSGRPSRCPQRQPPRQPTVPFKAITTGNTNRPYLSSSSPIRQQLLGVDAPVSLTMQSRAASTLTPGFPSPSIPLLHGVPIFCKSSHTLTTTVSAKAMSRQYFYGRETPSSPTPTTRCGLELLSPLPPLTGSALYGASALTSPEGAHKTAEQRQRAELYNPRGCKSLPAPLHPDALVIYAPLQPRAPLLRGTTGSRTLGCTSLCSRSSSPVPPPPLPRLSPS